MTEVKYDIGNGYEMSVEYDDYGITKITRELFESLIEKQMPKKANIDIGYDTEGNAWNNWRCPCCRKNYLLDDEEYNYCPQCGQKIDWSEWK